MANDITHLDIEVFAERGMWAFNKFSAIDQSTYDIDCDYQGWGSTPEEACEDLLWRLEDLYDMPEGFQPKFKITEGA
jgi:hypothetical protein